MYKTCFFNRILNLNNNQTNKRGVLIKENLENLN